MIASDGATEDWLGASVSISGNVAIIGTEYDDDAGSKSGSAYVFHGLSDGIPDECGACCGNFGDVACTQWTQDVCEDNGGVYLGDRTLCDGDACPIPAVSEWGLVVMTLLVLAAGTMVLRRRRAVSTR